MNRQSLRAFNMVKSNCYQGILDKKGHYDIDGVSFPKESGVIFAADAGRAFPEFQK